MSRSCKHLCVTAVALLILLVPARVAAQELLRSHVGSGAGDRFGTTAPAGDVNNDGEQDLLVGVPRDDTTAGTDAGSLTVISGADGAALFSFTGAAAGDLLGWSCAAAGDVNADGHADVAVGAPGTGSAPGYVRVHSGSNGALLRVLTGGQAGGGFGLAVAGARDLDADGKPDLIVGAPRQDTGGTDTGSAYAFSGADGSLLHAISGAESGDELGASVTALFTGTQMTDNEPAIIIGCTQGGNGGNGGVLVLSPTTFAVVRSFSGTASGDALGSSLANAGDVDDDGTVDVIAGSSAGAGYARVWSGVDGALLHSFEGTESGSGYAACVAGIGDVNGDGHDDVAVSEPLADGNGTDAGAVRVFSGADGSQLHHVHGASAGARFGVAVAYGGDLNADTLADFAVAAPDDDEGASDAGRVFLLSLTRWESVGGGLPGVYGIPTLTGTGGLIAQTEASLSLESARPVSSATLLLGYSVKIDGATGSLVPSPDLVTAGLLTGPTGTLDYGFEWPSALPSGFTCYYQFLINDPAAPGGQSRSNTVAATVP